MKLYVCLNCKQLVIPTKEGKCPICGNDKFTDKWEGMIIIIEVDNSIIAKLKNIDKPGIYPIYYKQ